MQIMSLNYTPCISLPELSTVDPMVPIFCPLFARHRGLLPYDRVDSVMIVIGFSSQILMLITLMCQAVQVGTHTRSDEAVHQSPASSLNHHHVTPI